MDDSQGPMMLHYVKDPQLSARPRHIESRCDDRLERGPPAIYMIAFRGQVLSVSEIPVHGATHRATTRVDNYPSFLVEGYRASCTFRI